MRTVRHFFVQRLHQARGAPRRNWLLRHHLADTAGLPDDGHHRPGTGPSLSSGADACPILFYRFVEKNVARYGSRTSRADIPDPGLETRSLVHTVVVFAGLLAGILVSIACAPLHTTTKTSGNTAISKRPHGGSVRTFDRQSMITDPSPRRRGGARNNTDHKLLLAVVAAAAGVAVAFALWKAEQKSPRIPFQPRPRRSRHTTRACGRKTCGTTGASAVCTERRAAGRRAPPPNGTVENFQRTRLPGTSARGATGAARARGPSRTTSGRAVAREQQRSRVHGDLREHVVASFFIVSCVRARVH